VRLLSDAPEIKRQYDEWNSSRLAFNTALKQPASPAQIEKWQKLYHLAQLPDGSPAAVGDHRTRLRLKPFRSQPRKHKSP
jgi:hypothetical protein